MILSSSRLVKNFTNAFAISIAVVTLYIILSWLAGWNAEIGGISFFSPISPISFSKPLRAIFLLIALLSAPFFMWIGPKLVISGSHPFGRIKMVWAAVKVLLVMFIFGAVFYSLTFFSGSKELGHALGVPFSTSVGVSCLLAFISVGVKASAGPGTTGTIISDSIMKIVGVAAAFSSGGPRDGLLTLVGVSGVFSLGLGSGNFVLGYLFVLPLAVTIPHFITWEGSGAVHRYLRVYQYAKNRESWVFIENVVGCCCLLVFTLLSIFLLVGGVSLFNILFGSSVFPLTEHYRFIVEGHWSHLGAPTLLVIWMVVGAIAMWGCLLWIKWMRNLVNIHEGST
ncbi:hypothetical protein [Vreelandella titanicae]|uniref:hypothetical protein n=1 Tax=Vreelandella titanicae TaxID=664683 RepID=UPI0039BFA2F5